MTQLNSISVVDNIVYTLIIKHKDGNRLYNVYQRYDETMNDLKMLLPCCPY